MLAAFFLIFCAATVKADGKEGWICGPDGCFAAISETKYKGWNAWRLCDGKTEAIVVPAIGRVMSFKTQTGTNWLWNATYAKGKTPDYGGWNNWAATKPGFRRNRSGKNSAAKKAGRRPKSGNKCRLNRQF